MLCDSEKQLTNMNHEDSAESVEEKAQEENLATKCFK